MVMEIFSGKVGSSSSFTKVFGEVTHFQEFAPTLDNVSLRLNLILCLSKNFIHWILKIYGMILVSL